MYARARSTHATELAIQAAVKSIAKSFGCIQLRAPRLQALFFNGPLCTAGTLTKIQTYYCYLHYLHKATRRSVGNIAIVYFIITAVSDRIFLLH